VAINTYRNFDTQLWFDNDVQKIASVSASIATAAFNRYMREDCPSLTYDKTALFDARCFAIPREEAVNYFIWRQRDAIRNSISGYAQVHFSHKQLQGKNITEMQNMLVAKDVYWDMVKTWKQRGWCVRRVTETHSDGDIVYTRASLVPDYMIPLFGDKREYIEQYLEQIEE